LEKNRRSPLPHSRLSPSDRAIPALESSFRLADAQELVARQMGFEGWQALKSGADAMTDEPRQTTPRPILSSISAQLFVANIKSSCDFYTNKLGFAIKDQCAHTIARLDPRTSNGSSILTRPSVGRS